MLIDWLIEKLIIAENVNFYGTLSTILHKSSFAWCWLMTVNWHGSSCRKEGVLLPDVLDIETSLANHLKQIPDVSICSRTFISGVNTNYTYKTKKADWKCGNLKHHLTEHKRAGPEVKRGSLISGGRACHGEGPHHQVGGCRSGGPQSTVLPKIHLWSLTHQEKAAQDEPRWKPSSSGVQPTYPPITLSHTHMIIRLYHCLTA